MTNANAALLLGLSLSAAPLGATAATQAARHWQFTVLLDGRPIGEHDFGVVQHGDVLLVDSEAHFKVRVALIPVYTYDHRNHEVWQHGCLASLASETNDNGHELRVRGALQEGGFEVDTSQGRKTLPGCISTFAYWDQGFLAHSRLLNSQTGEYQAVTVTAHDGQHFEIEAPKLALRLSYAPDGEWLGLESTLDKGRVLRYVRH